MAYLECTDAGAVISLGLWARPNWF